MCIRDRAYGLSDILQFPGLISHFLKPVVHTGRNALCAVSQGDVYKRQVYYLVTEQLGLAVYTGYEAVKAAVAIVLGIVFVFELPQGVFRCMAKAFVKIPSCRPFGEKSS